jgi:hypothetical protein
VLIAVGGQVDEITDGLLDRDHAVVHRINEPLEDVACAVKFGAAYHTPLVGSKGPTESYGRTGARSNEVRRGNLYIR